MKIYFIYEIMTFPETLSY